MITRIFKGTNEVAMSKFTALMLVCISMIFTSFSSQAEVNPFKKAKVYVFGDSPSWYFKEGAAVKSASRRDGSDTLYYAKTADIKCNFSHIIN